MKAATWVGLFSSTVMEEKVAQVVPGSLLACLLFRGKYFNVRGSLFHGGRLGTDGKSVGGVEKMFLTNVFILLMVGRSAGKLFVCQSPLKCTILKQDSFAGFHGLPPSFKTYRDASLSNLAAIGSIPVFSTGDE